MKKTALFLQVGLWIMGVKANAQQSWGKFHFLRDH